MSVEITGPKGYEFQYLITSVIAVKNAQCESLIVEVDSGEDAQLIVSLPTGVQTIDVQVKSSAADINLDMLCDWLNHFGGRQSTENLLSRLLRDERRIIVFVTTGRCCDETRALLSTFGELVSHLSDDSDLTKVVINSIKNIAATMHATTTLSRERRKYLEALFQTLSANPKLIDNALRRVIIWESTTLLKAEEILSSTLTSDHFVPLLSCRVVIDQLNAAIRSSRNNRSDAMPEVRRILAEHSGRALLGTEPHYRTGQEEDLLSILRQRRILLLTGRSLCGKTNMAKYLGQIMQREGLNVQIGQDVDEARRFLTVRHEEPRLFLLEDPFDQVHSSSEEVHEQEVLRRLVNELPQHRFIIITSKSMSVPAWSVMFHPHIWHDLTVRDPLFLMKFWRKRCITSQLLASLESTLEAGLITQAADELLQPGHLLHLSRLPDLECGSFEELCRLARFDILHLAYVLADRSPVSRQVHIALCLGASTIQAISIEELTFILSDSEERPGFSKSSGIEIKFGSSTPAYQFPISPSVPAISGEVEHEFSLLLKYGHIRTTIEGLEFTHPDYLAISREILGTCPSMGFRRLLRMLERGLASVSEKTALLSAQMLHLVYSRNSSVPASQQLILEVARKGLRSIFPAVRDAVLQEMLKWLNTLDDRVREEVLRYVHHEDYRFNEILWHGEVPWTSSSRDASDIMFEPRPPRDDATETLLSSLAQPHTTTALSPRLSWDLLHYLLVNQGNPSSLDVLIEMMKQPYSFIRAKAIGLLIERHIEDNDLCLQQLYAEENPGVLLSAFQTCFDQWQTFPSETRKQLMQCLAARLTTSSVAVVCSDLLTDFGDSHSNYGPDWESLSDMQRQDVWMLWATLFPVYLRAIAILPFKHNAPHMYNTLMVAENHLVKNELIPILETWVDWVEGQLKLHPLDDYELPVAKFLLRIEQPGERRTQYIRRLLRHRDTGYVATTCHFLISEWTNISKDEKDALVQCLGSQRRDARWLRAVAITRKSVPQEIQLLLTGTDDLLVQPERTIIERMSSDLLSDALHVYCGDPQPLRWYGFNHSTDLPWKSVLEFLVEQPSHRDFDLALSEMFSRVLNSGQHEWADPLGSWRRVCAKGGPDVRSRLFEHLLRESATVNNPQTFGFWPALFETAISQDETEEYRTGILDHLRAISINVRNIVEFFGEIVFREHLMPHLEPEQKFIKICQELKNSFPDESKRHLLTDLEQQLLVDPPRIYRLFDRIDRTLEGLTFSEANSVRQAARSSRNSFIDRAHEESEQLEDKKEIEDWVTDCMLS